jgi:hypothetical protein
MTAIQIRSDEKNMIINIPKNSIKPEVVMRLLERFRFEELIQKADFQEDIESLGDEIKSEWWKNNKEKYLKNIV